MSEEDRKINSHCYPLEIILQGKYTVDFYQREYVWGEKQIADLIKDLSVEFLKQWNENIDLAEIANFSPYFLGEIIISEERQGKSGIIDGQQRITSLTLLFIYLLHKYGRLENFPDIVKQCIYKDRYGRKDFNLQIDGREECMKALFKDGDYLVKDDDNPSVKNIVDRYHDISDCWNNEINENNAVAFSYWLLGRVFFSRVSTDSDAFAYIIFETMNDRGLSLTSVEMLRSYILANIDAKNDNRQNALNKFDKAIADLKTVKLNSKSKPEIEFFKIFLRTHYANDYSQANNDTDFVNFSSLG